MNLSFIIVEPSRPGNIGSAARAIKTMGYTSLRLVNPCDHLSSDARKLAYGSHDVLESIEVFSDLAGAIEDLDFIIATTAKNRTVWNDYYTPEECVELIKSKGSTLNKIGIVLGREESGLNTQELELCDLRSSVPLAAPYPSINLAQSVMIYAYAFSKIKREHGINSADSVNKNEQKALKLKAMELLDQIEITSNSNLSRRMMERLMQAGEDDIHLFLSFHRFLKQHLEKDEK